MKIHLALLASSLFALAAWSSAGCGPEPHASGPASAEHGKDSPSAQVRPVARPDGEACTRADECKSGVCEGEGCTTGPRCVAADRVCTQDLVEYCGCDGAQFHGSGSCARRPYKNKGACRK